MLDILDYLVDACSLEFHKVVSEKDFFTYLISLLKIMNSADLQVKVLGLIEKWGKKFETQKTNLPNFTEVYASLKKNGVTFPINFT